MIDNLPDSWKIKKLGDISTIKTGRKDANESSENGKYLFFTCSRKTLKSEVFSFSGKAIILAGNGDLNNIFIYDGDFEAYQRTYVVQNLVEILSYHFLFYNLKYFWVKYNEQKQYGSIINYIKIDNLNSYPIPIPPLQQQEKIVKVLDLTSNLIEKQKELLEKYNLFLKSKFIEMFGDPISNPMGWNYIKLSELGSFKNGLNFNYKENQYRIKCLGVGDFKNFTTIDNIEKLKTISIDNQPKNEYLLQNGDIIFVRSNGNKNLVGRCIEIYPNGKEITFSGFCIRLRLSSNLIIVPYLLQVLKSKSMRAKMVGRGANIQNLNQQILNGLDIPLPPIDIQIKFASIIEKLDTIKEKENQKLKQLEDLHNSLMQKAFKGEIL